MVKDHLIVTETRKGGRQRGGAKAKEQGLGRIARGHKEVIKSPWMDGRDGHTEWQTSKEQWKACALELKGSVRT